MWNNDYNDRRIQEVLGTTLSILPPLCFIRQTGTRKQLNKRAPCGNSLETTFLVKIFIIMFVIYIEVWFDPTPFLPGPNRRLALVIKCSPFLLPFTWHTDRQLRLIHLPSACRGRTAVRFPATSSHMCCVELALKEVLCTRLGSKGQTT